LTSEAYAALNRANVARFQPEMDAAQAERDRRWMDQRRRMLAPYGQAAIDRGYDTAEEFARVQDARNRRDFWMKAVLPTVGFAAGGAALGAVGGSGAASVPGAVGSNIAPLGGGTVTGGGGMGFSLGKLLGSRGFETGANALTSLFGLRSQNKANKYATDVNARLMSDQVRMEQERIARQEAAEAADRADIERRWMAEQAQSKQEFDALQEQRAYDRRILDEREGRRAMYRPYSEAAMRSLGRILGIG
jgi:hypothetical protein